MKKTIVIVAIPLLVICSSFMLSWGAERFCPLLKSSVLYDVNIQFISESIDAALNRASKEKKILLFYVAVERDDYTADVIGQLISQETTSRQVAERSAVFSKFYIPKDEDITDTSLVEVFTRNKISLRLGQPVLLVFDPYGNVVDNISFPISALKVHQAINTSLGKVKTLEAKIKREYDSAKNKIVEFILALRIIIVQTKYQGYELYQEALQDVEALNNLVLGRLKKISIEFISNDNTKEKTISDLNNLYSIYKDLAVGQKIKDAISQINKGDEPDLNEMEKIVNGKIISGTSPNEDKQNESIKSELKTRYKKAQSSLLTAQGALNKVIDNRASGYEPYERAIQEKEALKMFLNINKRILE